MSRLKTKSPFWNALMLAKKTGTPVILDGAVGTELDEKGADTSSPLWSGLASLEYPDLLEAIHWEYVKSGAKIVTSATFRTTRRAFEKENQPNDLWREAARRAVEIARKAAGTNAAVAGSVAPLEDCFSPRLAPLGQKAREEHALLCDELVGAGVDVLWLETFGTLGELEAAILSAKKAGEKKGIPFSVSVTTNKEGSLISGESISEAYGLARASGAAAFCVNCIPPAHVDAALEKIPVQAVLPLGVYANLGFADENQDWEGSANLSPEKYAALAAKWLEKGVSLIGGCCGSTPAHIRALSRIRAAVIPGAPPYP